MQCPKCAARDVIEIELKLPDGTEVEFCACHNCDAKWWDRQGRALALEEVLDLARKPRS
ncbi:MAG: hypothetical protein M3N51_10000 [Actinomycetota bacterium]|nr:hypothetical protein [Actinomycetota bacterium]